jgi:membrane-associated protease RseP (regulator of RpoE activity)
VLRRFVTQIDYGRKTLTFIDPAAFDPAGSGTPVAFVFYSHLPQVAGSFEGIPGQFDIDTGSRVELTLTKPFVDANDLIRKNPRAVIAVDGWGVGGPSRSYITRANELTLGPVRIGNLVAGFATQSKGAFADPNYAGNVGSGLLKRFVVTFDYARQMMYLRPLPAPVADSGTFDRAGLWINTGAAGLKVTDVTAAGPAAKAGVQVGDAVTAVDGVAASSISLSDLRARLRDGEPGPVVAFTIERGGATRVVHVTLEDQI